MNDCATTPMGFDTSAGLVLEAAFDGGRVTSDGGLAWLAKEDEELGVCEALAEHVPEWRRGKASHSLLALVRQRVFQIACGYEDQDDADSLRFDPLLKLACGRLPETGEDLASQPTMSRLENAATTRACHRMALAMGELYVRQRSQRGAPRRVLLDFDATDDPAHGGQEGTYYHGYYGQHMYHPLLVFDGETGQLIAAVLRPGNTHASRGAIAVLKRVVGTLREAWPAVQIELRADAGLRCLLSTITAKRRASPTPWGSSPTRASKHSRPPCSNRRKSGTRLKDTRPGCWPRDATGPGAGSESGGWCTRRRRWPKAPIPASWSPAKPRSPRRCTSGT
jgi:hypothetical protein